MESYEIIHTTNLSFVDALDFSSLRYTIWLKVYIRIRSVYTLKISFTVIKRSTFLLSGEGFPLDAGVCVHTHHGTRAPVSSGADVEMSRTLQFQKLMVQWS